MRAGKLDRLVSIERLTETGRNALNEPIVTWSEIAEVWAQQRPIRGEERFMAGQETGARRLTLHIRWFSGLTRADRIVYDGLTWDIEDIRELGRRVVHEIDIVARAT